MGTEPAVKLSKVSVRHPELSQVLFQESPRRTHERSPGAADEVSTWGGLCLVGSQRSPRMLDPLANQAEGR